MKECGPFGTTQRSLNPPRLTSITTEDLSHHILRDLSEALSSAGYDLVTHVETRRGWGDVDIVRVHVAVAKADASPTLRETIHEVVGTVLLGRRHHVEIYWARPTE